MTPRRTPYVSVNLTVPARNELQQATLRLSAAAGRRLSLSAVLLAALAVANVHGDEFKEAVTDPNGADE